VCLAVAIAAAVYLPKLSYDYGYSKAHEEASNNNSNQEEELSAAYIRLLYDAYEATSGNGSGLEEHKDVIQGYSVGYGDGWETAYRQGFEKALTWDKTLYDMNEYLNQSIEEDRPI
jgi:flagellar biosynthesis/type III secretory pathway protein FliH